MYRVCFWFAAVARVSRICAKLEADTAKVLLIFFIIMLQPEPKQ